MCKFIKDILFPLNLFGKKRVCVAYKVTGRTPEDYTLNVVWTGERMEIAYTQRNIRTMPGIITPISTIHTDGSESEIIVDTRTSRWQYIRLVNNVVYFNCTNVTKLIVNGEQLI